eukprot:4537985-Pleurochrysis_carterae.AAC.1
MLVWLESLVGRADLRAASSTPLSVKSLGLRRIGVERVVFRDETGGRSSMAVSTRGEGSADGGCGACDGGSPGCAATGGRLIAPWRFDGGPSLAHATHSLRNAALPEHWQVSGPAKRGLGSSLHMRGVLAQDSTLKGCWVAIGCRGMSG